MTDYEAADFDVTSLHGRRPSQQWNRMVVGGIFERVVWSQPDREAPVVFDGAGADEQFAWVTYRQADAVADQVAHALLVDPLALDVAHINWERCGDLDTLSTYHWRNRESRTSTTLDLVREVLRSFAGKEGPDLADTLNRARSIESIVRPSHLARGLIGALRKPGADQAIMREVAQELPLEWQTPRHGLIDGFRSTRPVAAERADRSVGEPPGPPSRHAVVSSSTAATPAAVAA